jgi:hypothetical protein
MSQKPVLEPSIKTRLVCSKVDTHEAMGFNGISTCVGYIYIYIGAYLASHTQYMESKQTYQDQNSSQNSRRNRHNMGPMIQFIAHAGN